MILHKGKRLWDSMLGDEAYPGTCYFANESGWMTGDVFCQWFRTKFLPEVTERPAILIYDGHLSHISPELIEVAMEANVAILKLPPHTSHILQPLDVSVFRGLKSTWDGILAQWSKKNPGKKLPKSTFADHLGNCSFIIS